MDGDLGRRAASFDAFQRLARIAVEARGVDPLVRRQVAAELSQRFAKLPRCAHGIPSPGVIQPNGDVNQRLQKQPPWSTLRRPCKLEDFVALKVLAVIEEADTVLEVVAGCLIRHHYISYGGP